MVTNLDRRTLDHLAQAVAVFTPNALFSEDEICEVYGISPADYAELMYDPYYQSRLTHHKNEIGTDRTSLLRAQAKLMTDSNLRILYELANDSAAKPSERLKAVALIADLADVKPKAEQAFSGIAVNIDFGQSMGGMLAQAQSRLAPAEVIEHEDMG